MAHFLPNGSIRFVNDNYRTSEILVLSRHMNELLRKQKYYQAANCGDQLDKLLENYDHFDSSATGSCPSGFSPTRGVLIPIKK